MSQQQQDRPIAYPPYIDNWTCNSFNQPFCIPLKESLACQQEIDAISVGALVFRENSNELLLIQRAAHDTFPSRWEIPGGKCDDSDMSVLGSLVRELYEETGLVGCDVGPCVCPEDDGSDYRVIGEPGCRGYRFSWAGKSVVKYSFLVTVESEDVKLDENEHQDLMWASEKECRAGKSGHRDIEFTTIAQRDTILAAFNMHREGKLKAT